MSQKSSDNHSAIDSPGDESNKDDYDIQTIEKHIQNLLNLLIKGLQKLEIEEKVFDKFQNVFYSSDSLEEYLDGLFEMLKVLVTEMEHKIKKPKAVKSASTSEHKSKSKNNIAEINEESNQNYENLEKVLQKYEAEIREHIRIEQQLKIYSDGLEEKISEKDAEIAQKVSNMQVQIDGLNNEKSKLSKLLYDVKFEKIFLEKKLKKNRESSAYNIKDSRDSSIRKVMLLPR